MPEDAKLVTTIIPTFERPQTLARAIQSVLNQTHKDFLLCIYDDNPSDINERVVRSFAAIDSRVKYYRHPKRIGTVANFDYGLQAVASPFFSFLSDDDILLPDFYERSLRQFEIQPEALMTCGITWVVTEEGAIHSSAPLELPVGFYKPPDGLIAILNHRHREWTGMMFRREVRDRIGGIDPRTKVPDYDYIIRASSVCPMVVFNEPVALFVHHQGSSTAIWHHGFVYPSNEYIAEHLAADQRIPAEVRHFASKKLRSMTVRTLFGMAASRIVRHDYASSQAIEKILRGELHQSLRAYEIAFLRAAHTHSALFRWVLDKNSALRRKSRKLKLLEAVREYSQKDYASLIQLMSTFGTSDFPGA